MVDNNKQVIENVFSDYCFYSEVYEIERIVKKEDFDKASRAIYKGLSGKMEEREIYRFFDYFIKSLLVDQISGIKIDDKYLTSRVSSLDEELEKADNDRKNTYDVKSLNVKVKALNMKYGNK